MEKEKTRKIVQFLSMVWGHNENSGVCKLEEGPQWNLSLLVASVRSLRIKRGFSIQDCYGYIISASRTLGKNIVAYKPLSLYLFKIFKLRQGLS